MAWVIAGCARPPYGECASRCVGRTWPMLKKRDKGLATRSSFRTSTCGRERRKTQAHYTPSRVADIMASKRPPPIPGRKPKMPFKRERPPHQRIIHTAQKTPAAMVSSFRSLVSLCRSSVSSCTYVHADMIRNYCNRTNFSH